MNKKEIMRDLYEIFGKHFRGETSNDEEDRLKKWISRKNTNEIVFQEAKTVWEKSKGLREEKPIDVEGAWDKFLVKAQYKKQGGNQRFLHHKTFKRLAIAASVLLAAFFVYQYFSISSYDVKLEASTEILRDIKLPDGSTVWLDKNATLEFGEDEKFRKVNLQGQAYFDVKHNPDKPFIISTGALKTRVVGTSFNINYMSEEKIEVSVISGKVKVFDSKDEAKSILLTKGFRALYNSKKQELRILNSLDPNFLSWKTGVLRFDNTPIDEVVKILSNHYNAKITPENSGEESRLTAEFDNLKLGEVIELIQLTTDAKLSVSENTKSN